MFSPFVLLKLKAVECCRVVLFDQLMQRPYEIHSGLSHSDIVETYRTRPVHYSSSWDAALSNLLHEVDNRNSYT